MSTLARIEALLRDGSGWDEFWVDVDGEPQTSLPLLFGLRILSKQMGRKDPLIGLKCLEALKKATNSGVQANLLLLVEWHKRTALYEAVAAVVPSQQLLMDVLTRVKDR